MSRFTNVPDEGVRILLLDLGTSSSLAAELRAILESVPHWTVQLQTLAISEKESPVLEVKRILHRLEGPPIAPGETEQLFRVIASPEDLSEFQASGLTCFYFHFGEAAAFQIMAFREDWHVRLELRRFR